MRLLYKLVKKHNKMLLILVLIVPVLSQDILGVNYSFDVDFYRTFNDKRCANRLPWHVIEYDSISVPKPSENSFTGIVASNDSCVSSFPIFVIPGSTLEFLVYMNIVSKYSCLIISVINEESHALVVKSYFNKTSDGFVPGWSRLKLNIIENGRFYINLQGRSRINDLVLVDSFRFIPNFTKIEEDIEQNEIDEILKFIPNTYNIRLTEELYDDADEYNEGSGDYEDSIIEPEPESVLSVLTIVFISIGVVTIVVLVAIVAYQLGRVRGRADASTFDADVDPPIVYNIPRVRNVFNSDVNI